MVEFRVTYKKDSVLFTKKESLRSQTPEQALDEITKQGYGHNYKKEEIVGIEQL
ncbi:hypothetical protein M1112_00060 [Candidatus Parvarchaeota archaeon]|nr:hypothetical protein [Candidatus Parvarchaeota archaeon]